MTFRYICSLIVIASLCCASANADEATDVLAEKMVMSAKPAPKGFVELYSESSYFYDYDIVTDTRLRYYHPVAEILSAKIAAYLGANVQYQSSGAKAKYYDNTVNPHLGLQLRPVEWASIGAQVGYRTVIGNDEQPAATTWDPRMVAAAGYFFNWPVPKVFTDVYGEASYVPRLSSTPVSIAWVKQGYRWSPLSKLKVDAYGEFYARESRSADLGPTMTEWRIGGRTGWFENSWNMSALIFHPLEKHTHSGELEGLLVVGGIF